MTLRTRLLPVVDRIRGIAGPSGVDIRTTQVTVRTRTWSGGRIGLGSTSDADLVLPQRYKVREVNDRIIASSGGRFALGDVIVGPITPSDGAGVGYTDAQLKPTPTANGVEIVYVLSGGVSGEYALKGMNTDRPFRYELVLARRRTTA